MDRSQWAQGRRPNNVVERKLDELFASLDSALSSPGSRSPDAVVADIKTRTDFLRSLLLAEGECHGGARPTYLVEAEARFAVLKASFDQWARRVVAAPAAAEEEAEESGCSGSDCSCTDSCQEAEATGDAEADADRVAVEAPMDVMSDATDRKRDTEPDSVVTREEVAADAVAKKHDPEREAVVPVATSDADSMKRDAEHQTAAETKRSTVQRRWWRPSAAWCGAAGVVAVVAVGLAVELAAVAHNNMNVYVVPT